MLKTASKVRRSRQAAASFDVEIAGVATAVPAHRLSQNDAASRAKDLFPQLAGHDRLFRNTGIKTRYACEPPEWYGVEHGWEARTEIFLHHALLLLEEVARGAIDAAGIGLKDIRAIVVNTITGLAIPSLAHEPARSTSFGGAAADLRARLRRRRRRIGKGRRGWR